MRILLLITCLLISCGSNKKEQETSPSINTYGTQDDATKIKNAIEKALSNDDFIKFFANQAFLDLGRQTLATTLNEHATLFKKRVEKTLADKSKFEKVIKGINDQLTRGSLAQQIDNMLDGFIQAQCIRTNQLLNGQITDGMSEQAREQLYNGDFKQYQPDMQAAYQLFINLSLESL